MPTNPVERSDLRPFATKRDVLHRHAGTVTVAAGLRGAFGECARAPPQFPAPGALSAAMSRRYPADTLHAGCTCLRISLRQRRATCPSDCADAWHKLSAACAVEAE